MGGKVKEPLAPDVDTSQSRTSRSASKRPLRKRIAWGLLGVIMLLVCSEVFVFRNADFYGIQGGFLGQFSELEHSWRTAKPEAVDTVILGDSMGMDGMRPELLAEAAGVSADSIFNFSISGGKAYEIYHTYLKYRDEMPNLKRAFIVVNEHQINNAEVYNQPMFRYYAGLGDRFRVMDKNNFGELVTGWVLKSFDLRTEWTKLFVDKVIDPEKKGWLREQIPSNPHGLMAKPDWDGTVSAAIGEETADRWFKDYNLDGIETDSFESLVRDLRERGIEVTLLRLPRSDYFEIPASTKHAAEQMAYNETIAAIANQYGAKFDIISNAELRTDHDFRDPNHLNEKGARWLAAYVAQKWMK